MKTEKSCGAIVYRYEKDKLQLLLLRHRHGGHWSFPKGHVESGETEIETALREVKEETGLDIELKSNFRHSVEYFPKPSTVKTVVYFLGKTDNKDFIMQESEISEMRWTDWDTAFSDVTFKNDRDLLNFAKNYLENEEELKNV